MPARTVEDSKDFKQGREFYRISIPLPDSAPNEMRDGWFYECGQDNWLKDREALRDRNGEALAFAIDFHRGNVTTRDNHLLETAHAFRRFLTGDDAPTPSNDLIAAVREWYEADAAYKHHDRAKPYGVNERMLQAEHVLRRLAADLPA